MSILYYNDVRSSDAFAMVLIGGNFVVLGPEARWTNTAGFGIGTSGSAQIVIAGQIFAATSGIRSYSSSGTPGGGNRVEIAAGGAIYADATAINLVSSGNSVTNDGTLSADIGVDFSGSGNAVYNHGAITGSVAGISFGAGSGADAVSNSGTIVATLGTAIVGFGPLSIDNTGVIEGRSAILLGGGDDEVRNTGAIFGDVDLGDGDDRFDTALGTMTGVVDGGGGDDVLIGGAVRDRLRGGEGSDELQGGGGDDLLGGDAGFDTLDGGGGFDLVDFSGTSAGSLFVDLANPGRNTGGAAGDLFVSIEGILGSSFDDMLYGDAGANRLVGGSGNDLLDGRTGADVMRGGLGTDTYFVDSARDRVLEKAGDGTGIDTVTSIAADYTLPDNVEYLILGGAAAIAGRGNALDNSLIGNDAANVLDGGDGADSIDGGRGADLMSGGAGGDFYYVDNAGDTTIEAAGGSLDRVYATVTYALSDNVELLLLTGTRAIGGTGNAVANTIYGNDAANVIDGGLGSDTMLGGGGVDRFVFSTVLNTTTNVDTLDFVGGTDKLVLSKAIFTKIAGTTRLSEAQFYAGTAAHDADDRIIFDMDAAAVFYDPDGDGAQTQVKFASLIFDFANETPATLSASDILLVG